jgi:ketosteroid isomerase-like protein
LREIKVVWLAHPYPLIRRMACKRAWTGKESEMTRQVLAILAGATMLAGCGGGSDPATVVDAVRATEHSQLQSIESDDLVGIARLYADNATLVKPDGSVLEGAVAIVQEYGDLVEDPNFALSIEPVGGWGAASDDLAVLASNVDFTTTDPATGEPTTLQMTSQTVWTRDTGSTWKIVSAIDAPRGGPAPAEPAAEEGAAEDAAEE